MWNGWSGQKEFIIGMTTLCFATGGWKHAQKWHGGPYPCWNRVLPSRETRVLLLSLRMRAQGDSMGLCNKNVVLTAHDGDGMGYSG